MAIIEKKHYQNFLVLIISIIISLLLAEIVLQIIGKPLPLVSGWRFQGNKAARNQLGFRGQPIQYSMNDYVIILLGDSQVEAAASPFKRMPERRLQYYLNNSSAKKRKSVKVFSLGAAGYGQDQQLLVLQEYFKNYRADLVVLWQTPYNDVWNNVFPSHMPKNGWPKPTFRLVGDKLYGPSENMGEPVGLTGLKLVSLWYRVFKSFDRDDKWEKYLPPPYKPITGYQGPFRGDWQKRWDNDEGLMRQENLTNEKTHYAIFLVPRSPRMQYGLDLTRKLLHEIEKLVKMHNGNFVIFNTLNPIMRKDEIRNDELVHLLNGKYYKTSKNQAIRNINFINSDFIFFNIKVKIKEWRVLPKDDHLNEQANDQVMGDLAESLERFIQ